MRGLLPVSLRFGAFVVVMALLTTILFLVFGQYRHSSAYPYSAVFSDVSRLRPGDTVRVAGIEVGSVKRVSMRDDKKVVVAFDADRNVVLTAGTRAIVRYLNLVGDRYLELVDGPGAASILPAGSQIPPDRTAPALDLDLLLGGLKPVVRGLNPQDVNALAASLVEIFQGEGATVQSLLSQTSALTNGLSEHNQAVGQLIDHLRDVLGTLSNSGSDFSGAIDRLDQAVSGLSADRDPIGEAIDALDKGTASLADLLRKARPPLTGTVDQLNRLAPALDAKKDRVDTMLGKLTDDYRKLARIGSYGSFINYYVCSISVRASDLQGRTTVFRVVSQEGGRCAES
jgi:phospholipid/cholesterol/gamma-HCH transport system substrate-binding protein